MSTLAQGQGILGDGPPDPRRVPGGPGPDGGRGVGDGGPVGNLGRLLIGARAAALALAVLISTGCNGLIDRFVFFPDRQVGSEPAGVEERRILTEDGRTLIVAESSASRLTAFDVQDDGNLSNRRVFADIYPTKLGAAPAAPDGICAAVDIGAYPSILRTGSSTTTGIFRSVRDW